MLRAMPRYSESQLNFFKLSLIVLDEFPKALRHVFKMMWDNKFPDQPWDDSNAVRQKLKEQEGPKNKIPTTKSYHEWDFVELVEATILAKTFEDAEGRTLCKKYLKDSKPRPPTMTTFTKIEGKAKSKDKMFALAINELQNLRRTLFHSADGLINTEVFNEYISCVKEAFTALYYDPTNIDLTIEKLNFERKSSFGILRFWNFALLLLVLFLALYSGLFTSPTMKLTTKHGTGKTL